MLDTESDGQPTPAASGDGQDEDGVTFDSVLVPGTTTTLSVVASAPGFLAAWFDWNHDGNFIDLGSGATDPGELALADVQLTAGQNSLSFAVEPTALTGHTYARFRFSSAGGVGSAGPADDGEVEDYRVLVGRFDLGDAPDASPQMAPSESYPTLLLNDGAAHLIMPTIFLGPCVDDEPNGQPNAGATGDDADGTGAISGQCVTANDDDDGVTNFQNLAPGLTASVDVFSTGQCFLDAWIDFNVDGDWTDAGEKIFSARALLAGANPALPFAVPASALTATTFARFRCSAGGVADPTGLEVNGGEVEDYAVQVGPASPAGAPGQVQNLLASVVDDTVNLSWDPLLTIFNLSDKAPATSYVVKAGVEAGQFPFVFPLGNVTSFSSPAPNGTFSIGVAGVNAVGEGPLSEIRTVTVPGGGGSPCRAVPDAPTGLTVTVVGDQLTLNWIASTGCPATSYVIRAGSITGASNILPGLDTGSPNPQFGPQAAPSATYFIRVAGRNATGTGTDSIEKIGVVP